MSVVRQVARIAGVVQCAVFIWGVAGVVQCAVFIWGVAGVVQCAVFIWGFAGVVQCAVFIWGANDDSQLVAGLLDPLSLSLSLCTARDGPRPPSRVSSILPGLGRLLSSFYTLASLHLPSPMTSVPCLA